MPSHRYSIRHLRWCGWMPVAAFHSQRFHELYRQVNGLRDDPTTQPMERTAAQLDELAGLILTAYTSGGVDDGDH